MRKKMTSNTSTAQPKTPTSHHHIVSSLIQSREQEWEKETAGTQKGNRTKKDKRNGKKNRLWNQFKTRKRFKKLKEHRMKRKVVKRRKTRNYPLTRLIAEQEMIRAVRRSWCSYLKGEVQWHIIHDILEILTPQIAQQITHSLRQGHETSKE